MKTFEYTGETGYVAGVGHCEKGERYAKADESAHELEGHPDFRAVSSSDKGAESKKPSTDKKE